MIYAANDLTVKNGEFIASSGGYPAYDPFEPHLRGMIVEGTLTFDGCDVSAICGDFREEALYTGGAEDDAATIAIEAEELVVKNSNLYAKYGNVVWTNADLAPKSIGLDVAGNLTVIESDLSITGGEAAESIGIRCGGAITAEGGFIEVGGQKAEKRSVGLETVILQADGPEIEATASEAPESYGVIATDLEIANDVIYSNGIMIRDHAAVTPGFHLTNGNLIVFGYQGDLVTDVEDFPGVVYRPTHDAEPEVKPFDEIDTYYGNRSQLTYDGNGVEGEWFKTYDFYNYAPIKLSRDVPIADGMKFVCWNTEPDGSGANYYPERENIIRNQSEDLVLYAIWECAGGSPDCPLRDYADLNPNAWYHDGISMMIEWQIMVGTGEGIFEPAAAATRGTVVTTLYRLVGAPEVEGNSSFTDVEEGAWYADAIAWAEQEGLVGGYGDGRFGPNDAMTREQMVTVLYRIICPPEGEMDFEKSLDVFADGETVSDWAYEAMCWAVDWGIINGISQGGEDYLAPTAGSNRAQLATVLYRIMCL